jgi:L-ribulose-5-phosphate 4-epimerase
MDKYLVSQVVDTAAAVTAGGAISASGHGSVSLRVPATEEMYFTGGPSLRHLRPESVARVGLDGDLLEGEIAPVQAAAVALHTAIYQDQPGAACVVHTHSPYATAHAVAQKRLGCWTEAMPMFGMAEGVPVAAYGPCGSNQAVTNIRQALVPGVPAVLLANHGVLVFHRSPELAVIVGQIIEEAAQAAVTAEHLGGPVQIPPRLRGVALQPAMTFGPAWIP